MEKVDLVLVNPNDRGQMAVDLSSSISAVEPPVWTGMVAAFVRQKGFSVRIIDANAFGYNYDDTVKMILKYNPLLAGISVMGANPSASSTPKMVAARGLLNGLKKEAPLMKTFFYGIHPSALPEKTLKEEKVDFISRGESFYTIPLLLEVLKGNNNSEEYRIDGLWYMKNGKVISNGWGKLVLNLDDLPFVAWDLLPMEYYRAHNWHCFGNLNQRSSYAVIYSSLGCPFNCSYCNIHALYDGTPRIRFRSIKNVIAEIDFLVQKYQIKNIKILDELFVLKEDRVMEFCDLLIKRDYGLNIWAYARVDTVNEQILKKMKASSINWLALGIESANIKVRKGVTKGQFDSEDVKKVIDMIHESGIHIVANFIFGLPEDNLESMGETLTLSKELNCEYTNFYVAMAYPGSKLYEETSNNGISLSDNWLSYAQLSSETIPFPTKYLTSAEILSFRDRAFNEYHGRGEYFKMIESKFGKETVSHIKKMLEYKIKRKLLERKGEKV
ncbi:MAG: radical SAM protein [Candidatus Omnitrophota bacterium]|nr:B12-binding domain-containing radical SAM protein [Candidatus Omnitrophota bacterium]